MDNEHLDIDHCDKNYPKVTETIRGKRLFFEFFDVLVWLMSSLLTWRGQAWQCYNQPPGGDRDVLASLFGSCHVVHLNTWGSFFFCFFFLHKKHYYIYISQLISVNCFYMQGFMICVWYMIWVTEIRFEKYKLLIIIIQKTTASLFTCMCSQASLDSTNIAATLMYGNNKLKLSLWSLCIICLWSLTANQGMQWWHHCFKGTVILLYIQTV